MKIMLIGASSYVGARLYDDLQKTYDVVGTYFGSFLSPDFLRLDITDAKQVQRLVKQVKPDVIVHAANNANSRWCEANPELAKQLNETSTQSVVDAANTVAARLIYVSSFAAIHPTNVYGRTKRASEAIVAGVQAGWVVLRPSLIIGLSPNTTNDRPFNRLLKNLDQGTPAEYDRTWKFQPTWLGHMSEVIGGVIEKHINQEVIPIAVPQLTSRYDIAHDILQSFDIQVTPLDTTDVPPEYAEDLSKLPALGLPSYTYAQVIQAVTDEIKHRI